MANGLNPNNLETLPKLFRIGGSGFTTFQWQGHTIGWAQAVSHTSPQPVAAPSAIQPLDQQYPMQILTPAAIGAGTLVLQMYEMFNEKVWDQIMRITDATEPSDAGILDRYNDLSEIFLRLSALSKPIYCTKLVYPANTGQRGGQQTKVHYADVYHNCVITDIRDDENIAIGTMEVIKTMTIQYTYSRRLFNTLYPFSGSPTQ